MSRPNVSVSPPAALLAVGRSAACMLMIVAAACGGGGDSGPATTAAAGAPAASSAASTATAPATAGSASASTPTTLATEGGTFTITGVAYVAYGAGDVWITREVSGPVTCSNAYFGADPVPDVVKSCRSASAPSGATTTTTTAAAAATLMPGIDTARMPAPAAGYATDRIAAANVADPSQNPVASDIGDFREYCEFSHMSYDDPIVAPGAVGPHLHTFFGNTGTNAASTAASIASTGNSTCAGGTLNRTAYWFPSMIDTKDGTPLTPNGSLIYYKQGYNYIASSAIRPFPDGLRMIAGNAASTGLQDGVVGFTCYKPDRTWTTSKALPTSCPAGSTLTFSVSFPQCWDGVNLDSPDHRSHMAYPGFGCPATHPVPLASISFQINYSVTEDDATRRWRLSSDDYDPSLPGGYSGHADWFNGWKPDILDVWTTRCINASMDCHAFLIGDGRTLY